MGHYCTIIPPLTDHLVKPQKNYRWYLSYQRALYYMWPILGLLRRTSDKYWWSRQKDLLLKKDNLPVIVFNANKQCNVMETSCISTSTLVGVDEMKLMGDQSQRGIRGRWSCAWPRLNWAETLEQIIASVSGNLRRNWNTVLTYWQPHTLNLSLTIEHLNTWKH